METNDSGMKPRYLYYRPNATTGLGNASFLLNRFLEVATSLGRIAIIDTLPLTDIHNNGIKVDCNPTTYYDLGRTICYGNRPPNYTTSFSYIMASEFDINQFSDDEIKVFHDASGPTYITEEDDKHYNLIILEKIYEHNWSFDYYLPQDKRHNVILAHSEQVRTTALKVIDSLISKIDAKHYYHFKAWVKNNTETDVNIGQYVLTIVVSISDALIGVMLEEIL